MRICGIDWVWFCPPFKPCWFCENKLCSCDKPFIPPFRPAAPLVPVVLCRLRGFTASAESAPTNAPCVCWRVFAITDWAMFWLLIATFVWPVATFELPLATLLLPPEPERLCPELVLEVPPKVLDPNIPLVWVPP